MLGKLTLVKTIINWFKHNFWILIPIALVFFVYQRAFWANLVFWDDDVFILRNEILKMPFGDAIKTTFTSYFHGDYLPLTIMSYWTEIYLFGQDVLIFHTTNLILHAINVALVYLIIKKFSKDAYFAFAITLIFAIHPLQTEPVMWISERKSLLSGVFTLSSLLVYLHFLEKDKVLLLVLSWILFFCSLISKTTAILIPLIYFFLDLNEKEIGFKKSVIRLSPILLVIALAAYVRVISYDNATPGVSYAMFSMDRILRLPIIVPHAFWFYIEKFFWPKTLSALYDFFSGDPESYFKSGLGVLTCVLLLTYGAKRKNNLVWMGILIFTLFLLPILHLIPRANYVNDRYMYLPIIGFSIVILDIVSQFFLKYGKTLNLKRYEYGTAVLMAVLALPMGLRSWEQSEIWLTNLKLWEDTVPKNPDNILARNALGLEYHERKRYKESIEHFEYVLKMNVPTSLKLKAINNLANIYTDKNYTGYDLSKAAQLYEMAIQGAERPNQTYELRVNLAQTWYLMGQKDQARQLLQSIFFEVQRDPDSRNRWLLNYIPSTLQQFK